MQLKFLSYKAFSSSRLAKKKIHDNVAGCSCSANGRGGEIWRGEGRGRVVAHEVEIWQQNTIVVAEKGYKHHKDKDKDRCWKREYGESGRCGEQLRCGALWLWFRKGKGKGEKEREKEGGGGDEGSGCISISISSRRVSLEKFECGSWASSGMMVHEDGESTGSLYFDLPIELIRNSVVSVGAQSQSLVKAAFVFDKNGKGVAVRTKGKLAEESGGTGNAAAAAAASSVSVCAVSLSAPPSPTSCIITPRLRKAREEFNALLEAHTTTL